LMSSCATATAFSLVIIFCHIGVSAVSMTGARFGPGRWMATTFACDSAGASDRDLATSGIGSSAAFASSVTARTIGSDFAERTACPEAGDAFASRIFGVARLGLTAAGFATGFAATFDFAGTGFATTLDFDATGLATAFALVATRFAATFVFVAMDFGATFAFDATGFVATFVFVATDFAAIFDFDATGFAATFAFDATTERFASGSGFRFAAAFEIGLAVNFLGMVVLPLLPVLHRRLHPRSLFRLSARQQRAARERYRLRGLRSRPLPLPHL